jgi:hypothetical protein
MPKQPRPSKSRTVPEDTSDELTEEQLEDVAGGIIIVGGSVQQSSSQSGALLGWATFPDSSGARLDSK